MDELSPELTPTFIAFLSTDAKGPGLDPASIDLLSRYGVVDISTMVIFSQFSLSKIFRSLTDTELQELPKRGLKRLSTYGSNILANDLINPAGFIHLDGFMPTLYNLYRKTEPHQISSNFRTSLRAEMDQRLRLRTGLVCTPSMTRGAMRGLVSRGEEEVSLSHGADDTQPAKVISTTTQGGNSGFSNSRGAPEFSRGVKFSDSRRGAEEVFQGVNDRTRSLTPGRHREPQYPSRTISGQTPHSFLTLSQHLMPHLHEASVPPFSPGNWDILMKMTMLLQGYSIWTRTPVTQNSVSNLIIPR
jgi:hypothetical protein